MNTEDKRPSAGSDRAIYQLAEAVAVLSSVVNIIAHEVHPETKAVPGATGTLHPYAGELMRVHDLIRNAVTELQKAEKDG